MPPAGVVQAGTGGECSTDWDSTDWRRGGGSVRRAASSAGVCGGDSGVRPAQQPGGSARPGTKTEDTGQMTRGQSRNIPQCLAEPRLTGVFYPCGLLERVRQR